MILNKYLKKGRKRVFSDVDLLLILYMRLIQQIPHAHYLIQLHEYNGKYLLKITLDNFEQIFKVPINEVDDLYLFTSQLNDEFWNSCLNRFLTMREDFNHLLNKPVS